MTEANQIPAETTQSEDRYVLFLDLLGFKAQVARAESDPAERQRIREILLMVQDTVCAYPHADLQLSHFSDCLVYSVPRTAAGLSEILTAIEVLTINLLQYDMLVRGGLAAGWAVHHGPLLYGTAVTEAYELESKDGGPPLTRLSALVLSDVDRFGTPFPKMLLESAGIIFVNYLRQFELYRHQPIWSGKWIMDEPGKRIVDFVCQRLNSDAGRVLEKAEWFQQYWNQTVVPGGVFGSIEKGVTERYHTDGPAVMIRRMVAPAPQPKPPTS